MGHGMRVPCEVEGSLSDARKPLVRGCEVDDSCTEPFGRPVPLTWDGFELTEVLAAAVRSRVRSLRFRRTGGDTKPCTAAALVMPQTSFFP